MIKNDTKNMQSVWELENVTAPGTSSLVRLSARPQEEGPLFSCGVIRRLLALVDASCYLHSWYPVSAQRTSPGAALPRRPLKVHFCETPQSKPRRWAAPFWKPPKRCYNWTIGTSRKAQVVVFTSVLLSRSTDCYIWKWAQCDPCTPKYNNQQERKY